MMIEGFKQLLENTRLCQDELGSSPGIENPKVILDLERVISDKDLYKAVAQLYYDGHHALAVEKAYKFLVKLVKQKSGRADLDGSSLMKTVFSPKNPHLRINTLASQSEQDEQLGYMDIFSGVVTGIRNPRAHEPDWEDTNARALELLSLANHLVEMIRNSTKIT